MPGRVNAALTEFVRLANIAAFTKKLKIEADPVRRKLLMTLLEEHKAMAPAVVPVVRRP